MARTASKSSPYETVEQGNIYFIYRPRVEETDPEGIDDIQQLHVVLAPEGQKLFRLINVGRKRLPDVEEHERHWGYVEAITKSGEELEEGLRRETYGTKTRGERVQPAARPAGEGVYALVRRDEALHLAYDLELPEEGGPVQEALNIAPKASFVLSVRNPEKGAPRTAGRSREDQPDYPKELQEDFGNRRFASGDLRLLDYEGAEILLVGARSDPEQAYKVDLGAEDEDEGSAEIFKELRFAKSRHPARPLLSGEWA
jgi:hypothetical protein